MEDLPTKYKPEKELALLKDLKFDIQLFSKLLSIPIPVPILRLSNLGVDVVTKDLCLGLQPCHF
jgi:hypothetical protein